MKSQLTYIYIVSTIFLLSKFELVYCQHKSNYPVSIENVDGVKTVINPRFPRDKRINMDMIGELSIGTTGGDDNYMFNTPSDLKINDIGNVYMYDSGANRFQVFDKEGIYLHTVGKEGQGPGEYLSLSFDVGLDGTIYVLDNRNRRLSFFDSECRYIRSVKFNNSFYSILIDDHDRIYTTMYLAPKESKLNSKFQEMLTKFKLLQIDNNGNILRVFGEFLAYKAIIRLKGRSVSLQMMRYSPMGVFLLCPNGTLYYGFNEEYLISVYNPDAKLLFKFGRDYIRKKNPRYTGESNDPKYIPAFATRFLIEETNNNI
jgi:hypothetical protein